MYDSYNRNINYLRVSVTDRCNLRCTYCVPEEGIKLINHNDIISYEEILNVVKEAVGMGISKVRITGGEPLVRKNILFLVEEITKIEGIRDFSMTTNGILLKNYAKALYEAGMKRINVSLDTLNSEKYFTLTRGGNLNDVLEGIQMAKEAGFSPIKINCVVKNSSQEVDAKAVSEYCKKNDLEVRFIHEMDLKSGHFDLVEGGTGGDCSICNRLRLTATGKIKPCLFNDMEYDIKKLGIKEALKQAIENKPACGSTNFQNEFNNIGG